MRQHLCAILGFLFLALLCSFAECRSIVRRQISLDASLDPALQEVEFDDEDRDKRAVEHTNDPKYAKFAIKNALLGFVFNPSKGGSFVLPKPRPITTTTKRPTTTEDIVIFEKNQAASLEIPSQLFGGGFSLITKLSNTAGDYMINSAIRFQRLLEVFRPMIISMFGAKGLVSEVTINKPIFSDGSTTR